MKNKSEEWFEQQQVIQTFSVVQDGIDHLTSQLTLWALAMGGV